MAEDEHRCVACQETHQAAAWYARKGADGKPEYLCGVEYSNFPDEAGWVLAFPRGDE